MAPYPRMVTSACVRPSGRVMIAMRLTLPRRPGAGLPGDRRAARSGLAGQHDHPDERVAVVTATLGVPRRRQPLPVGMSLECPRLDRGGQGRGDELAVDRGRQHDGSPFGDDVPQPGLVKRDAVDGGGDDTGLLVLAADGTVEMANPAAGRWLDELGAGDRPGGHLPLAVRAGGPAACLARARIRTPAGRWVVVRGSLLGDGPGSRVAVLLEAAPPARAGSADHRCVWRHRTQAASHRAGGAGPPDQRDRRATAPVGVHGAGPPEVDLREVGYRLARRTRSPALLRPLPATPDPARHPRNLGSALTPVADNPGGAG
jgi:hypothetical protein